MAVDSCSTLASMISLKFSYASTIASLGSVMKKETMCYCIWLRTISSLIAGVEFTGTWSLLGKQVQLRPPPKYQFFLGGVMVTCFVSLLTTELLETSN